MHEKIEKLVDDEFSSLPINWKPLKTFLPTISPRGQAIESRPSKSLATKAIKGQFLRD